MCTLSWIELKPLNPKPVVPKQTVMVRSHVAQALVIAGATPAAEETAKGAHQVQHWLEERQLLEGRLAGRFSASIRLLAVLHLMSPTPC